MLIFPYLFNIDCAAEGAPGLRICCLHKQCDGFIHSCSGIAHRHWVHLAQHSLGIIHTSKLKLAFKNM